MSQSMFDPNLFLDAQTIEINERRNALPVENPESEDGFYIATIGELKTDSGVMEKGDRAGEPWMSVKVPLKIQVPPSLQSALELGETLTLTDRVFLDLMPGSIPGAPPRLDNSPGKNRGQKHYRELFDLNKPGEPFAWRMLQGRPLKVKLQHRIIQPTDGSESYPTEEIVGTYRF